MRTIQRVPGLPVLRWLLLALLAAGCSQGAPGSPALPNGDDSPATDAPGNTSEQPFPDGTPPEETPASVPENSQTGSPGGVECYEDLECFGGARVQTAGPLGHVELLGATCVHLSGELPACECRMRMLPAALEDAGAPAPYEVKLYPGNRPGACSEWTRAPGCLYCENEFPGCSIDDAGSCDAVCADMTQRYDVELQKTITATARLARCTAEDNRCEVVTEIDGVCYAGPPGRVEPPVLDCSLSDAELLQQLDRPSVPSCEPRPTVTCTSADDCPRGLGCNAGVCGRCSDQCSYPEGQPDQAVCEGDSACAEGELCTLGMCLPRDNIGCRFFTECPANNSCMLSGFSELGRGNAATRSFCQPYL